MDIENPADADRRELVAEFALEPIQDDQSYQATIAILDRLFALDDRRTPAEWRYFRELARLAHQYEQALAMV